MWHLVALFTVFGCFESDTPKFVSDFPSSPRVSNRPVGLGIMPVGEGGILRLVT